MTENIGEKEKMERFKDFSINDFMAGLSAKTSVPGGGGAAALIAAAGAALSSMVANFTVGKPKYAAVEEDMQRILKESEALRQELLSLMDKDAEAFSLMSAVYRMSRDTEEDKGKRAAALEEALKACGAVPLELMRACLKGVELSLELAGKGSDMLISDAGCAAAAFEAALKSAALNVYINTSSMQDKKLAEELDRETAEFYDRGLKLAAKAYDMVSAKIRES